MSANRPRPDKTETLDEPTPEGNGHAAEMPVPAPTTTELISAWLAAEKARDDAETAAAARLRVLGATGVMPVWVGDDGYRVSKGGKVTKVVKVVA